VISRNHPNRSAHNWLAYDTSDRLLAKYISLYKGVLYDLGAGEAPYREFFLNYAERYVAVDWAVSYHEVKADIIANLNDPLPIENEVADTVTCLSVLEHLQQPQTLINEAFRILKSGGGVMVLQVPWQWLIHEAPHDYFRYTPYGLELMFRQAGFVDILIEPQAGFFTTIVLKLNYFTHRLIRGRRVVQWLLRFTFGIGWFVGQTLAPILDKLDNDWALESSGYFVTARKP
jgi:2-polyprenyl-3-methyl-5-hydroxy-6-metoxy-1,4-benzoquinol methylase